MSGDADSCFYPISPTFHFHYKKFVIFYILLMHNCGLQNTNSDTERKCTTVQVPKSGML